MKQLIKIIIVPTLLTLAAFTMALAFKQYFERTIVLLFLLATFGSAWFVGMWGGIVATVLSIISIDFLFLEPEYTFGIHAVEDLIILFIFTLISIAMSRVVSGLRLEKERFETAVEAAGEGYWDWNIRTGKAYFSPGWIASLGYSPGDLPNTVESWKRLVHPDDIAKTFEVLERHFQGLEPMYEVENRLRTKSGEWRWNLDRGKVIERDRSGKPLRMIGFDIDITSRKQAEEERTARLAAEWRDSTKDQVLSLVSHEVRNPVAVIQMAIAILRIHRKDPERCGVAVQSIEDSCRQLVMLTNDLLDWSRLASGKFLLQPQPANLSEIIESAWHPVATEAERKNIRRIIEIEAETEQLLVDSNRLTQVFWNLFTNAVKFSSYGGVIRVSSKLDNGVSISVKDAGRGLSKDSLPHVFDRHWQSSSQDAAKGGLGLGLSIVKAIVERHGGTISAYSAGIGKGSTFTVSLNRESCLSYHEKEVANA
ncbi:MAG: PAS domain-containing protein [Deltaproteobacteria bacterium]|nr:PAS domain-containing protein [Deltaproteobacteria bacterium]